MRNTTLQGFLDPEDFQIRVQIDLDEYRWAFDLAFRTGSDIPTKFVGGKLREDERLGDETEIEM